MKLFLRDAANAAGANAISLNLAGEQTVVLTRDITKLAFTCDSATGDVGGTKGASVAISVSKDGVIFNLHNKLSGTTWQDESGNGNNMTLSGDFEITDE